MKIKCKTFIKKIMLLKGIKVLTKRGFQIVGKKYVNLFNYS